MQKRCPSNRDSREKISRNKFDPKGSKIKIMPLATWVALRSENMFSNENGLFGEAKKAKVLPNIITSLLWVLLFLIAGQGMGAILAIYTKKLLVMIL